MLCIVCIKLHIVSIQKSGDDDMTTLAPIDRTALQTLAAQNALPAIASVAVRFAYLVTLWSQRRRTRRALMGLPAYRLKDVGLTTDQADIEARKLFWIP